MGAPSGVGMTAVGVAYARSVESARDDGLFWDPWAAEFVAAGGTSPMSPTRAPDGPERTVGGPARLGRGATCFLDEVVLEASGQGCAQVLLLGAGLDTRALRLPLPPGTRVFEIDTAEVLDFKDTVLASSEHAPVSDTRRVVVRSDLRDAWSAALLDAGFDPGRQTVWVVEGLLLYLSAQENEQLLDRVGELCPTGSRLGAALTPPGTRTGPLSALGAERDSETGGDALRPEAVRAMWKSDGPADPVGWFAGHGWRASVVDAAEQAGALGRGDLASSGSAGSSEGPRRSLVDALKL